MQEYYLLIKGITLLCAIIPLISLIRSQKQNEVVSICKRFFLFIGLGVFSTTLLSIFIVFEIDILRSHLPLIGFLFLGIGSIELSKFSISVFYDNSELHYKKYVKVPQIMIAILMGIAVFGIVKPLILTAVGGLFALLLLVIYAILSINLFKLVKKLASEESSLQYSLNNKEDKKKKDTDEKTIMKIEEYKKTSEKIRSLMFGSIVMLGNVFFNLIDGLSRALLDDPTIFGWLAWVCFMGSIILFNKGFKK
jgi:hypothetical protein